MRKSFLSRIAKRGKSTSNDVVKASISAHVQHVVPVSLKPITIRTAILSWEPQVIGGSGRVRGVQFTGCVQRHTHDAIGKEDGFKATFDGDRYMFSTNETPMEYAQEVRVGALLRFTVWGMQPSDALDIGYGSVVVVDGVKCTMKGSNIYFNATLVVCIEPEKINFVDFLQRARYCTDGALLSKMQLNPNYIQGCSLHADNMPPYYFEDVVMKVRADQPHFKPYVEFNFTMVDGKERIAGGATVRPALSDAFIKLNGVQNIMDNIAPFPEKWNFTLVGYLTSHVPGSKQRVFATSGFFY